MERTRTHGNGMSPCHDAGATASNEPTCRPRSMVCGAWVGGSPKSSGRHSSSRGLYRSPLPARPPISPGSRRVVGLGRHRPASCIPPRMHRWIIASCGDMRLRRRRSTYTVVVVVSLSCSSLYSLEGTIIEKIRTIHGLVWSQTSRRSGRGGRRRLSLRSFGRWRRRGRWPFPGTWRSSGPCRGTGT
jgi:hypothetical protein